MSIFYYIQYKYKFTRVKFVMESVKTAQRDRCRIQDVQDRHRSAFTVNVSENNAYKPIKQTLTWLTILATSPDTRFCPEKRRKCIGYRQYKNNKCILRTIYGNVVLVCGSFTFRRRFFSMPSTAKTCSPTAGRSMPSLPPV